jgi:hypothetical protein
MFSKDESGIAMVTALLVTMVVLLLGVVVVALSAHNVSQSSFDRKRVQSIGAAEAGLDGYLSALQTSTGTATCNPMDADLTTTPPAHYHVTIQLYSAWPPVAGTELACPPPTDPLGALVISKGTAVVTGNPLAVSRTMETLVRLVPIYGGFNKAIFSDTVLNMGNKFTLNGNQGNDGDVYTNGNFSLSNNTSIAGTVYAQGYADIAQGVVKANVWAGGYVNLSSGIVVFGNGTSSTSYIALSNNSTIQGNAKAATTITGGTINGTKTPNSPSPAPPAVPLPQIGFIQQAWLDAGYQIVNYSSCAAAKTAIDAGFGQDTVVRISPTCALTWGNNSTVGVPHNLAIITDGSVTTVNQTNWNGPAGNATLFLIRPYQTGLNCASGNYDTSVSNNTNFNNLQVFVYTQCNISFANNNAGGSAAQLIGGTVDISNQCTVNFVPILVPGFNLLGYSAQPSYVREITNS